MKMMSGNLNKVAKFIDKILERTHRSNFVTLEWQKLTAYRNDVMDCSTTAVAPVIVMLLGS